MSNNPIKENKEKILQALKNEKERLSEQLAMHEYERRVCDFFSTKYPKSQWNASFRDEKNSIEQLEVRIDELEKIIDEVKSDGLIMCVEKKPASQIIK